MFFDTVLDPSGTKRIYNVAGQVFFVSVNDFMTAFDCKENLDLVQIDLTYAHLWDQSAIRSIG